MPSGRPLDSEAKAKRREALERYATKNREVLREAARARMRRRRALAVDDAVAQKQRTAARRAWTKYRENHREEIRAADVLRAQKAREEAAEQARVERLKRRRAAAERKKGKQSQGTQHPFLRQQRRYDPNEVLTANQIRCRALRRDQLELDNGDDSDEDVPPGMCGCVRTQCQLLHKNETQSRKDWKIFHLKYPNV